METEDSVGHMALDIEKDALKLAKSQQRGSYDFFEKKGE